MADIAWSQIVSTAGQLSYRALFMDQLDEAQAYYHPKLRTPFSSLLTELHQKIGSYNCPCAAVPICSWPESFEWNGQVVPSKMKEAVVANAIRLNFMQRLSSLAVEGDKKP